MSDNPKIGRNLEPAILSDMSLNPSDQAAYLEGIRKYAEGQTTQAINWYLKRKGPISLISKGLRFAAIVLGTIGGLLPLLPAPLMAAWLGPEAPNANAQFGYVFLALAGAFVLSDKLFGVSSNWMRYMTTVMALKRHQAEFEMDWARLLLDVEGNQPSADQQKNMLDRLTDFRLKVVGEMEQETHAWVAEFKSNLAQLEQQARSRLQPEARKDTGKGSGQS
jgi:hypothetical protein